MFRRRIFALAVYGIVMLFLGAWAKDTVFIDLGHSPSPAMLPTVVSQQGTIETAFSPNSGATAAIIRAISTAQSSLLVSAYSFTSMEIAKALLDAKKRKVDIKLILDKSQVSQKYSATTFFSNQGFDLRIDVKHAIYHNKFMVIDDKTVITGSFNFTKAAETKNAENVLIIRDNPDLARRFKDTWLVHWQQAISVDDFTKRKLSAKNRGLQ